MSGSTVAFIIGLILALVEEFQAQGRSLVAWAVVAIAIGLLIGRLQMVVSGALGFALGCLIGPVARRIRTAFAIARFDRAMAQRAAGRR